MSPPRQPCLERQHRRNLTLREGHCSLWHFRQAVAIRRSDFLVQTYRASPWRSMVQRGECLEDGPGKWRDCLCRFPFSEREAWIGRFRQGQWGEVPTSTGRILDCNLPARHNEIEPCVSGSVHTSDMTPVQRSRHDTRFEGYAHYTSLHRQARVKGESCRRGRQSTPQSARDLRREHLRRWLGRIALTRLGSLRAPSRSSRGQLRCHPSGMANGVSSAKRRRTFSQIRDTLLS